MINTKQTTYTTIGTYDTQTNQGRNLKLHNYEEVSSWEVKFRFRFRCFSMLNEWGGANLTTKGGASFNRSLLCTRDEERGCRPLRSTHTRQENGQKLTYTDSRSRWFNLAAFPVPFSLV